MLELRNVIDELVNNISNVFVIINGNINYFNLQNNFSSHSQHVSCSTRREYIPDLFFFNVQNAYKSLQLSPIINSC